MFNKVYYRLHRLASKSPERGEYSGGYWQDIIRRQALELCRGLNGRMLEVGCGEGLFLAQLASQNPGLEIWGVDNNEVRLKEAQERFRAKNIKNINLFLQEATDLRFEEGYFDTIACINVFLNMPSIKVVKESLAQIKRVCKKSGKVIFDIRNRANPILALKYMLAPYYDGTVKDLPLKVYGLNQVKNILEDLGFSILKERFIGFPIRRFSPIIIIEAQKNVD